MATSDDGFISRWSRRKSRVREGLPASEAAPDAIDAVPEAIAAAPTPAPQVAARQHADRPITPPQPTLQDVALLTRESDYSRFIAPGVGADVRNAAMKKLFSDPHFNVMDGLDTYIDDYSKPDPLPSSMLRKMAQAQALGLLRDDPDDAGTASAAAISREGPAPDENPDLRLQPNDAAGCAGPEPGPGEDAGRVG